MKEVIIRDAMKWRPFAIYRRAASLTFGAVFLSNLASAAVTEDTSKFAVDHPDLFATAILGKSLFFGALWPSFIVTAIVKPRNAFILGTGIKEFLQDPEPEPETATIRIRLTP